MVAGKVPTLPTRNILNQIDLHSTSQQLRLFGLRYNIFSNINNISSIRGREQGNKAVCAPKKYSE